MAKSTKARRWAALQPGRLSLAVVHVAPTLTQVAAIDDMWRWLVAETVPFVLATLRDRVA